MFRNKLSAFGLCKVPSRLLFSLVSVLLAAPGLCDSAGEYPGTGDYADWKRAVDTAEDGVDYAQKGNYTMALRCYDAAIKIYALDSLFYFNKGIALKKTGKAKDSIVAFKKAVELERKFSSAWYNLGNAQQDEHDYQAAEASYRQALKLVPSHMKAWFNLGENLLAQKKLSEAKDAFTKAGALPGSEQDMKDISDYLADIDRQLENAKK